MIINLATDKKEKKNENENKVNIIIQDNNKNENNLSMENLYGEEEDEDDLLKSETESNYSYKSLHGIIDVNQKSIPFKNPIPNIIYDKDTLEINNNNILNNISNNEKKDENEEKNKENNENKGHISEDLFSSLESREPERRRLTRRRISRDKISSEEEESEELEDDEDEDDDDEDEDNESESINPYNKYINSEIVYKNFMDNMIKGNYIYEKNKNKYYIYLNQLYGKKGIYLCINYEFNNKIKKDKIYHIIYDKYLIKKNEDKQIKDNNIIINNILNDINNPEFLTSIKEEENKIKNEVIIINKDNYKNFSNNKKIKIYYINYLNIKYTLNLLININWKLNQFLDYFSKLYHIPNTKSTYKSIITIFIKNEQFSGKDLIYNKKKLFLPTLFDYEKDYIFILEHINNDIINIDLGSKNSKNNFKGEKVPHIVFSSHNNFYVESILVSNKLNFLECEIYVFKDDYYFNLERNIGKYNFKKAKEALSSSDWKNKCKYVTSIKSIKSSPYKNNEDVISFSISNKLILCHDKSYVFLITSPNLNINVFNSGSGDQGLFIISYDDKAILNGFICKKISDFTLDNSII